MAMVQLAMMENPPYYSLRDAVFAHPTLAESLNNLFTSSRGHESTLAPGRVDRDIIAERLTEARARTLPSGRAAHRRRAPDAARPADEPDPLGSGAHRPLRGALAHPQPRRADRVRRDAGDVQSLRASPQQARRAAAPGPGRVPRDHGRDPRPGARPARHRPTSTPPIRCCATATCTTWCCSTSTSTTRPCCRRCSSSWAALCAVRRLRAAARAPASPRQPGAMVRFPGGAVTVGTDDRASAYDNERPRAPGRAWRRSGSTCIRSPTATS